MQADRAAPPDTEGDPTSDVLNTWILAGQSNMQGVGPLDDPRRDRHVDPRVEVLSSSGEWTDAREPLHRLWQSYTPVHRMVQLAGVTADTALLSDEELARRQAESRRVGAGLGPAFGSRLADATGERVGLIPCAHGGTALEQWEPGFGGVSVDAPTTLYGSMMNRVARARSRSGVVIRGMLWYQGEADATPVRSADYAARFDAWAARVRADLGDPELPLILVQLGRFAGPFDTGEHTERSWDRVREAQRTVPGRVPGAAVVSAVDLGLSDPIHIGTPGLARLGRRMAQLAIERTSGPDVDRVEFIGPGANGHILLRVRCIRVRGGWNTASHFPGFVLCDADGVPVGRLRVVDAHPDPREPSAILVVTTPLEPSELAGVRLSYGQGYDPVCLAVDEADLPLPAFGPQAIVALD